MPACSTMTDMPHTTRPAPPYSRIFHGTRAPQWLLSPPEPYGNPCPPPTWEALRPAHPISGSQYFYGRLISSKLYFMLHFPHAQAHCFSCSTSLQMIFVFDGSILSFSIIRSPICSARIVPPDGFKTLSSFRGYPHPLWSIQMRASY